MAPLPVVSAIITNINQFVGLALKKSPNPEVKLVMISIIQLVNRYLKYKAVLKEADFNILFPKTVALPKENAASIEYREAANKLSPE